MLVKSEAAIVVVVCVWFTWKAVEAVVSIQCEAWEAVVVSLLMSV